LKILDDAVDSVILNKDSEALALLADYDQINLTPFSGETGFRNKVLVAVIITFIHYLHNCPRVNNNDYNIMKYKYKSRSHNQQHRLRLNS
jgi:hypothetical protein